MSTDPRADNALFVDIATRWRRPEERHELVSVKFTEAKPSLCHDNAAAYVSQYGGAVIHGFLVMGSQEQSAVLVHAHSVVRSAEGRLLDPTLIKDLLQGQAFIEYHGTRGDFLALAKRMPQASVSLGNPTTFTPGCPNASDNDDEGDDGTSLFSF